MYYMPTREEIILKFYIYKKKIIILNAILFWYSFGSISCVFSFSFVSLVIMLLLGPAGWPVVGQIYNFGRSIMLDLILIFVKISAKYFFVVFDSFFGSLTCIFWGFVSSLTVVFLKCLCILYCVCCYVHVYYEFLWYWRYFSAIWVFWWLVVSILGSPTLCLESVFPCKILFNKFSVIYIHWSHAIDCAT